MKDFSAEIRFQTTRSGGKGGQNVNKVETAVIGTWNIAQSLLIDDNERMTLHQKLANRINKEGFLVMRSQEYRSQLENKEEVVSKINVLIHEALKKKKIRVPTRQSKASKERRLQSKKRDSEIKNGRQKFRGNGY